MRFGFFSLLIFLSFCLVPGGFYACAANVKGARTDFKTQELGKFLITYYYLVLESDYQTEARDAEIKDMKGRVLARVSSHFKKDLAMEGTGKLTTGQVVNFAGVVNGESRYVFTKKHWGFGIGTCELLPFRTIAVDPKVITPGTVIQIDETVGMQMEDGTTHDGLWIAEDVGALIKGNHLDLFIGTRYGVEVLKNNRILNLSKMNIRKALVNVKRNCL